MRERMRWLGVALMAWSLDGLAAQAVAPGGPARDDPSKAVYVLVENTLVETTGAGTETAAFYAGDGSGWRAVRKDGAMAAPQALRWGARTDRKLCTAPPGQPFREPDCREIRVDGALADWPTADGGRGHGQVLPGDAWGMEARATGRPVRALSGREAVEALVGNTFLAQSLGGAGDNGAYHFQADGSGHVLALEEGNDPDYIAGTHVLPIRWAYDPKRGLCIGEPGQAPQAGQCRSVSVAGERVLWRMESGFPFPGRLAAGDPRKLSATGLREAEALRARLIGNTLVVIRPDRPGERAVFLQADGQGRAAVRENGQTGPTQAMQWMLRPDLERLCLSQVSVSVRRAKFSHGECVQLRIDGARVRLVPREQPALEGRIEPGNAWGL